MTTAPNYSKWLKVKMEISDADAEDNARFAFLLGSALRNDDTEQFLEVYDSIVPKKLSEEKVCELKEKARVIASLSELEYNELVVQARDFSLAQRTPPDQTTDTDSNMDDLHEYSSLKSVTNKMDRSRSSQPFSSPSCVVDMNDHLDVDSGVFNSTGATNCSVDEDNLDDEDARPGAFDYFVPSKVHITAKASTKEQIEQQHSLAYDASLDADSDAEPCLYERPSPWANTNSGGRIFKATDKYDKDLQATEMQTFSLNERRVDSDEDYSYGLHAYENDRIRQENDRTYDESISCDSDEGVRSRGKSQLYDVDALTSVQLRKQFEYGSSDEEQRPISQDPRGTVHYGSTTYAKPFQSVDKPVNFNLQPSFDFPLNKSKIEKSMVKLIDGDRMTKDEGTESEKKKKHRKKKTTNDVGGGSPEGKDENGNPILDKTSLSSSMGSDSREVVETNNQYAVKKQRKQTKQERLLSSIKKAENIPGHRGNDDIDSILSYINNDLSKRKSGSVHVNKQTSTPNHVDRVSNSQIQPNQSSGKKKKKKSVSSAKEEQVVDTGGSKSSEEKSSLSDVASGHASSEEQAPVKPRCNSSSPTEIPPEPPEAKAEQFIVVSKRKRIKPNSREQETYFEHNFRTRDYNNRMSRGHSSCGASPPSELCFPTGKTSVLRNNHSLSRSSFPVLNRTRRNSTGSAQPICNADDADFECAGQSVTSNSSFDEGPPVSASLSTGTVFQSPASPVSYASIAAGTLKQRDTASEEGYPRERRHSFGSVSPTDNKDVSGSDMLTRRSSELICSREFPSISSSTSSDPPSHSSIKTPSDTASAVSCNDVFTGSSAAAVAEPVAEPSREKPVELPEEVLETTVQKTLSKNTTSLENIPKSAKNNVAQPVDNKLPKKLPSTSKKLSQSSLPKLEDSKLPKPLESRSLKHEDRTPKPSSNKTSKAFDRKVPKVVDSKPPKQLENNFHRPLDSNSHKQYPASVGETDASSQESTLPVVGEPSSEQSNTTLPTKRKASYKPVIFLDTRQPLTFPDSPLDISFFCSAVEPEFSEDNKDFTFGDAHPHGTSMSSNNSTDSAISMETTIEDEKIDSTVTNDMTDNQLASKTQKMTTLEQIAQKPPINGLVSVVREDRALQSVCVVENRCVSENSVDGKVVSSSPLSPVNDPNLDPGNFDLSGAQCWLYSRYERVMAEKAKYPNRVCVCQM